MELGIKNKRNKGFTIMEIVVATTVFTIVVSGLLALFNETLKINRQSEALRQVTQGMRSFVEFLVKEVRNGQINYFVINGQFPSSVAPIGPCTAPPNDYTPPNPPTFIGDTYSSKENKLGIINSEGIEECIYYGDSSGNALGINDFSETDGTLIIERAGKPKQVLNPPNFKVENLMFLIRPTKDPYTPLGGHEEVQPFVTMNIKFVAELPTGESFPIYYQTTVSTNKYDVPRE